MNLNELNAVAIAMVANGKGILAADESTPTIKKRFDLIDTESTEESRRRYREMLFTTAGVADYIGGVILFDETLRQSTADGVPFPKYLSDLGIIAGIKVDKGAKNLAGFPGETVTEGLDGLRERLNEYYELGAKFAKWRAVINIGDGIPSAYCLRANAHALYSRSRAVIGIKCKGSFVSQPSGQGRANVVDIAGDLFAFANRDLAQRQPLPTEWLQFGQ